MNTINTLNTINNEFLNTMYSNFLETCIIKPTRILKYNRPSLVDNIFVNIYDKKIQEHMRKNMKTYYQKNEQQIAKTKKNQN